MITYGRHTHKVEIDHHPDIEITIGNFTSIGSGLKVYSGKHACIDDPKIISTYPFRENFNVNYPPSNITGKVTIGNDVWIATDVRILEGVTIGNGAIIGAGSLVSNDVPDYAFVAGNPARLKYKRFSEEVINKLIQIQWWNWTDEEIKEALNYMIDIDTFIKRYE